MSTTVKLPDPPTPDQMDAYDRALNESGVEFATVRKEQFAGRDVQQILQEIEDAARQRAA